MIVTTRCHYAYATGDRFPAHDRIVKPQFRARLSRQAQVGRNRAFGVENTRARFEHCHHVVGGLERGESFADLLGGKEFMRETVLAGAAQRSGHDDAVWRADHEPARLVEKSRTALGFEFAP